jgi:FAD/FMN-containing dehydrogenase
VPDTSAVEQLRESLTGSLVLPDDAEYDEARSVWNGMIDRRPALIGRCADAGDVVACVDFARAQDLPVSVRCGGHGVSGKAICDDGLVIDLSQMSSVTVDVEAKTARIEGGARLGNLDAATQPHGLGTTAGFVSETGVGGLTLGGGLGYLGRRFGLTCDNLLAADVVTADGQQIRASAAENPDLFWALRGGGGNFGIVTAFEFQLHEVGPDVLVGQSYFPISETANVLRFYREFMSDAPDELAAYAFAVNTPPVDPFPAEHQGKPCIALVACHSGDLQEAEAVLEPLKSFGNPFFGFVQTMPYVALQQSFDAGAPDGQRYYWKSQFQRELSDEAIDTFAAQVTSLPGPFSIAGFEPMGGAINRVDADATAFPHRDAGFALGIWSGWADPADDEAAINWTRGVFDAMSRFSTGGVYSNYLDHDDGGRDTAAFSGNLERLQQIKAKYDPDNFFSANQNITPATGD